jgi:hypothetical protein
MLDNILGGNNNTTSGQNEPSKLGDALSNLLGSDTNPIDQHLSSFYAQSGSTGIAGVTDAPGGGLIAHGIDSIFNPFYIFRYAKYGEIGGETYYGEYHRDINSTSLNSQIKNIVQGDVKTEKSPLQVISEEKTGASNPSASQIISWAATRTEAEKATTVAPYPYQWNDFLWCKWYGKIPNNRMLTLRRYPIPVEDNLQVAQSKGPLIPLAQAVTWWGEETGNNLSSVLGMTWGLKWTDRTASIQDITGNEVAATDILDTAGLTDPNLRKILLATVFANPSNVYAGTGFDDKVQNWVKESYEKGPYWNRIRGPINVINKTQIRDTGYDWEHPIQLVFTYKLRTFNNINPKIAMLDLITNFLALTYNKAEFWGGGIRYFQKTGYTLPGLNTDKFENGDFIGGIQEVVKQLVGVVQQKGKDLAGTVGDLTKGVSEADLKAVADALGESTAAQNVAGNWVKNLMQAPLSIRTFLDGRAVGEWHLTVGNPMNPIAVIGNLCLGKTKIEFSESLGLDDFPTEVKFTVNLTHGRPRAKQDIESMFNLGAGDMSFTPIPPPSSAFNSYGERNSTILNNFKKGRNDTAAGANKDLKSAGAIYESADKTTSADFELPKELKDIGKDYAGYFKANVLRSYGAKFAVSPALPDYFINLKTKD